MDTLELVFPDPGIAKRVIGRLNPIGFPSSRHDSYGNVVKRRQGYRRQDHYLPDGRDFFIAGDAYHFSFGGTLMQIHLSQFHTFPDCLNWLEPILAEDLPAIWTADPLRLDTCIDIGLPLETVAQMVTHPRAHRITAHKSPQGTSVYIGRRPRVTALYEKTLSLGLIDYTPNEVAATGMFQGTRIEVRHTGDKVPISSLSELTKLASLNPFSHLQVSTLDEALIKTLSPKQMLTIMAYLYLRDNFGAQVARKRFSQGGNFRRLIGQYMGTAELDLAKAWQHRLNRFFGPDMSFVRQERIRNPAA